MRRSNIISLLKNFKTKILIVDKDPLSKLKEELNKALSGVIMPS
jgi:predicted glycosyltransferase